MRETDFLDYLSDDNRIQSKVKAVNSRMNKARMVERHFNESLDSIVADNERMYNSLLRIKQEMNDANGSISNSLRKYYEFVNGKPFPTLAEYKNTWR